MSKVKRGRWYQYGKGRFHLIWLENGYITSDEMNAYPEDALFLCLSDEDRTISLTEILKTEGIKLFYS